MEEEKKVQVERKKNKLKIKYTSDWTLWVCYIILCTISLIEVFSAGTFYLKSGEVYSTISDQVLYLVTGFVFLFLLERWHYKNFRTLMYAVIVLSLGLLIYSFIAGESSNGATRSVSVLGKSVQPAEFCKLMSAMTLAYILSVMQDKQRGGISDKGYWIAVVFLVVLTVILLTQGGSNALLIFVVGVTMILFAKPSFKQILISLGIVGVFVGILLGINSYFASQSNAVIGDETELVAESDESKKVVEEESPVMEMMGKFFGRMDTWKNRLADYNDTIPEYKKRTSYDVGGNSQEHHAYMAIANGRSLGVGPGNSRECSRLQLAFSDYIYAIVLEELGLWIGGLLVIACYLGIIIRACFISMKCKNAYASILMMGMALMICCQAFYHMGISVGLLPVSGQPLPFISKGGTSIWVMSSAMGIMLSISRYAVEKNKMKIKTIEDDSELPEDMKFDNPSIIF